MTRRLGTRMLLAILAIGIGVTLTAQSPRPAIESPADRFGHAVGADGKLVRWDGIVDYLRTVAEASPRVNVREIGPTTHDRPFVLLEISSEATMADLDRYKQIQRRLYFQDHVPGADPDAVHTDAERRTILEEGKAVVLITCTIHATEVGAAQMTMELVHQLATDPSPRIQNILDNVIFLLVPSLNPDGQAMIANWYNRFVGTEYEAGPIPWLYHPYVGHDNNRDMYMYSQRETRLIGEVLYQDWFPSIWLDEHQMGSMGARIFTMPATDPINPNVHPLIYRLNGVYGQAQAAALEKAGKVGIIYDQTYTNFWQGAMAWTGWWHNQVGMLTEVASARIATPTEQEYARLGVTPTGPRPSGAEIRRRMNEHPDEPLPAPFDVQPRTTYPRPWLGGRWSLRDIVEYELVATLGLLETAADTRRQLQEQIYEVNRATIAEFDGGQSGTSPDGYGELPSGLDADRPGSGRVMAGSGGAAGTPYAVVVGHDPHDGPAVTHLLRLMRRAGVTVERATDTFTAGDTAYPAGTYVIRLGQVFGRYAKDMLEAQPYPEVRPAPGLPARPPYDVTAWSLGMMMGVETTFVDEPFEAALDVVEVVPLPEGRVDGSGDVYVIDPRPNDSVKAINRLLATEARVRRATVAFAVAPGADGAYPSGTWIVDRVRRAPVEALAAELGLVVQAVRRAPAVSLITVTRPRLAVYQPWGSNMDEGWTRWLLDDFGFEYTTLHPQDLRAAGTGTAEPIADEERATWPRHVGEHAPPEVFAGPLAERFDVVLFTHQGADNIVEGSSYPNIPPTYRGGIGEEGLVALRTFVDAGGTVIGLGDAANLFVEHWPIPVRNVVDGLDQDDFLIPGSILRVEVDQLHPLGWGMPARTFGYFIRSPAFTLTDGFSSQDVSVAVRYPNVELRASGWTRGEEHIAGRAAGVQVEFAEGGRLVLLGLRPQHRVQTHATFKLLFNALMLP